MAPDHGEDDFVLCKADGIDPVFAVEADGKYREDWLWLGGQGSVINNKFNAPDGPICTDLREAGALLAASADFQHSYPHRGGPRPRSSTAAPRNGSSRWTGRSHACSSRRAALGNEGGALERATLARSRCRPSTTPAGCPRRAATGCARWSRGGPTGCSAASAPGACRSRLFVDRKTGELLVDPEVNARIVAAIREGRAPTPGTPTMPPALLGNATTSTITSRSPTSSTSGSTAAAPTSSCSKAATGPSSAGRADLYLEGSDQHRGWFQSSLLESCGTRGRAPYNAVLTHGFTLDAKGMKMSKSLGNTVNPLDLMRDNGADILRLWALSVDYIEDHRIGKEILAGVADQYRKLRNTFRYLLGALDGFSDDERVDDVATMPELERYMLHLPAELDAQARARRPTTSTSTATSAR